MSCRNMLGKILESRSLHTNPYFWKQSPLQELWFSCALVYVLYSFIQIYARLGWPAVIIIYLATAFSVLRAIVDGFGSVLVGQELTPPLAHCSICWWKQQRNGMTNHMITLSWGCLASLSEAGWPNGMTESYASDLWAGPFGRAVFFIDNLVVNCHEGNWFKDISTNENSESCDSLLYANKK